MSMIPYETRFVPATTFVRRRMLPTPGRVLVTVGEHVEHDRIVAQGPLAPQVVVVDLAKELNTDPETASGAICVREGQQVTPYTVLARRWRGFGRRQVRAPMAGQVTGIHAQWLFIQGKPQTLSLRASLPGDIVEIYAERGVALRTSGAWVRGAWANEVDGVGRIVAALARPDEPLSWQHIQLCHRGALLVGGLLCDHRALFRARQFRASGLILGSIHPNLRALCEQISLPIIVTEGMGRIPMARPIFELLRRCDGRMAAISGALDQSPDLVIPFPVSAEHTALTLVRPMQVGVRVRLTRGAYLGSIGVICDLPASPQKTAAGTMAEGAYVRLGDGQRVFAPFVNLESIS